MQNPICLSPLKFRSSDKTLCANKSYSYGHSSPILMPCYTLDPFQFVVPSNVSDITYAQLISKDNATVIITGLIDKLKDNGLTVSYIDNKDTGHVNNVCVYPGLYDLGSIVPHEGIYTLLLRDNKNNWYTSEPLCFTNDVDRLLTIEYWNAEGDFIIKNGVITFADNFHFKLRLNTELGKPEYNFEEEVTKRLGYNFIESQVSKKIYKFNAVVPEHICDAMRIIRLCSNKIITSLDQTYDALTFDMSVDWQDQGDLASVNCEFEVDNIIVNLGGYGNIPGPDYNIDFSDDFNSED